MTEANTKAAAEEKASALVTALPTSSAAAQNEAALASLLAQFFLHNPDKTFAKALTHLAPEGFDFAPGIEKAMRTIRESAEKIDAAEEKHQTESETEALLDLKRDWTKLFRGISPDYGPTAPYAFLFLKGTTVEMMKDLAALYIDGGYDGYQIVKDRIDYIGTCFQYLATVDLQIVTAIDEKLATEYTRLRLCRKVFLEEYLTPWVETFAERARKFVQTDFYGAVLDLTVEVIDHFAAEHKTARPIMSAEESREIALKEDKEITKMVSDMEKGREPDLGPAKATVANVLDAAAVEKPAGHA